MEDSTHAEQTEQVMIQERKLMAQYANSPEKEYDNERRALTSSTGVWPRHAKSHNLRRTDTYKTISRSKE